MRDPADVIADALARDPHVTLTGSTERDVARFLLAALRDEYGWALEHGPCLQWDDKGCGIARPFIPVPVPEGSAS